VDFNLSKTLKQLKILDTLADKSIFEEIVENPINYVKERKSLLSPTFALPLRKTMKKGFSCENLFFSPSQEDAFSEILDSPLTLLWGPPGEFSLNSLSNLF